MTMIISPPHQSTRSTWHHIIRNFPNSRNSESSSSPSDPRWTRTSVIRENFLNIFPQSTRILCPQSSISISIPTLILTPTPASSPALGIRDLCSMPPVALSPVLQSSNMFPSRWWQSQSMKRWAMTSALCPGRGWSWGWNKECLKSPWMPSY